MSAALRHSQVFLGQAFALVDVHCGCGKSGAGEAEFSLSGDVAFPRRGVFVKHVGREAVVADANSVVFFDRGEPYRVSHPVDGGDECTVMRVREDVLRETLAESDPAARDRHHGLFGFTHAPAEPAWLLRIGALRRHVAGPLRDTLAAEEFACELLGAAASAAQRVRGVRPARRTETATAHRRLTDAVQMLLAARFDEPIGLCELARAVCSSPYHLARLFRRQVGLSIHEYRTRLRLAAALPALADGARDLTALALEVGFSSHSHFATAFGRYFGVTPSEARGALSKGRLREMSTILKA